MASALGLPRLSCGQLLTILFVTLWIMPTVSYGRRRLVVSKRDISVKMGRSVYLDRYDLVIASRNRGEDCRVEAIMGDPITQRVGRIDPPIFDCDFHQKSVQYIHNGSPLLESDQIRLLIHKFTNTHTQTEFVEIQVNIKNATNEVIFAQGLRPIVVPDFKGLSNVIDATSLRFRHSENQNVSCIVGFTTFFSPWPIAGKIVMGERRKKVESVKKNCREFLFMNLHYQHETSPTPEVDYLPLSVELYDPAVRDEVISERFYLPIYIKGAFPNAHPLASSVNGYTMDVDQFVLSTIIPGVISAKDYETDEGDLVFNITEPFGDDSGYLVHLDNHAKPIKSFVQDDLTNHRIAYRPPAVSYPDRRVYDAKFTVFDTQFSRSLPITLHVAVRPSDTTAPHVAVNTGLTLLEGQSRRITEKHFQVVDKDNLRQVHMYIKGGLQHGTITVRGKHSITFSMGNVKAGHVIYKHDDSDSTRDRIELRISDGSNTVLSSFPITIIPRDDTPPYMVNNLGLQINEGGMRKISEELLLAHDADSSDENIIYTLITPPSVGDIIRKIRPNDSGTKVFGFRQRDVMKGQIYYKHHGDEIFSDFFSFTLQDHQTPPNESERMKFHIVITPMNENPPHIDPAAKRIMYIEETEVGFIKPSELRYTDVESANEDLTYTVTTPPYFVYNLGERDAGKLVATHNISRVEKGTHAPQVMEFTQADIDHLKIAYIPPQNDIGPESRLVRMAYTVEDASGNKLYGQTFDIEIKPVNDRIPEFLTNKMLVEEGGILGITTNQLSAVDLDTPLSMLKFILDAPPRYGKLQNDGASLKMGSSFIIEDLQKKHIRYLHDGSDVNMDTITLALTDGINQATKVISIEIVPIDDQSPTLSKNLRPQLIVSEGEEAVITTRILAATDGDTNDENVVFLIVRQPRYGVLQLKGQPATKFSQEEVKAGEVSFLHTSGEIGTSSLKDFASVIISDQNFRNFADQPVHDLNITITPINNQKPLIILGNPVFVAEGESFRFSDDVLKVRDLDSKTKEIRFVITKQPQWGFIENTKPSPGSEKKNVGIRINSFKYEDILDGSINYVQANHKGVEPVKDELEFYATDGKLNSDLKAIKITVVPANDEAPDLMLNNFSLIEGGKIVMSLSILDALDMDVPKDQLKFHISQPPEYGSIVRIVHTSRGRVETEVKFFTLDDLHGGMKLIYKHNGAEIFNDKFAVTVSDGKHEIKKVCNVSVKLHNDEIPTIVKNVGLELDYGDQALISSVVLLAKDDDNDESEITYLLIEIPKKGFLQFCPDPFSQTLDLECIDFELGNNFTQQDVDLNKIRYVHTTSMGNIKKDSFVFVLTDGTHKRHEETFEIRIKNAKNENIAVLNKGMAIREGERVAISTYYLSASDESTKADEIVFAIIKPPKRGMIEHIKRRFVPITSFTQLDIASQNVVYNHLTKNDIPEDSFSFTVTNGLSEAKNGEFHIKIRPMDRVLPTLVKNSLFEVLQGTEQRLSPLHLKATDPDTAASKIIYNIEKEPTYGRLYNGGVLVTRNFTQNDIDLGSITYESDGTRVGLDNFLFTLSDGHHEGFLINGSLQTQPARYSIFIQPLLEDAPRLVVNKRPDSLEYLGRQRYGYKLTNKMLRAVDSDSDSSGLMYIITKKPTQGHIENIQDKRYVRRAFTQEDLDESSLLYIIDRHADKFTDSFGFRIEDARGNKLTNQTFQLGWSKVEFDRDEIFACENVGILSISIVRTGNLEQSAFIGIGVREMAAKKGQDFIPSTSKQIQFDPGESRATWQINILDDGLEESNEKLKLTLVNPVNVMMGKRRKLRMLIINAEDGNCPQYLGMITKFTKREGSLDGQGSALPLDGNNNMEFHKFGNVPVHPGFDNTYLNTEADRKNGNSVSTSPTSRRTSHSPRGRKRGGRGRKRKGGKGKKRNRKRRRKNRREGSSSSTANGFDITSPSYPAVSRPQPSNKHQVPKECTSATKGLLSFDDFNYQLTICDGVNWKKWGPGSSNDGATHSACHQGWYEFDSSCYKPVKERMKAEDAEKNCLTKYGGHLASIKSMRQLRWLGEKMSKKSFWIGLVNKGGDNQWEYTNGDHVSFLNWKNGKPRARRNIHKKNCVVVKKRFKWRNKACNRSIAKSICEVKQKKIPKDNKRNTKKSRKSRRSRRQRSNKRSQKTFNGFFHGNS